MHHARLGMFNALMHVVAVGEGDLLSSVHCMFSGIKARILFIQGEST